jgi:hypothetical protein
MKPYAEAIEAWKVEPGVGNVGRPELMGPVNGLQMSF